MAQPDSTQEYSTDILTDQNFSICNECSCVQLTTLIDPSVLYGTAHNNTFNTPKWLDHHRKFSDFIFSKKSFNSILEVGGSGNLFTLMNKPELQYTCLDINTTPEPVEGITYKFGNCESYDYSGNETIILSHVFEHLLNPRSFIGSLSKGGVKNIFISIPNMKALIDSNSSNILHNEHTYYIDKVLAVWLFEEYGYYLEDYFEYESHSLFMYFCRKESSCKTESSCNIVGRVPIPRPELEAVFGRIFQDEYSRLSKIVIKPQSFVVPAGLYGQFITQYCKISQIIGFLDNDKTKQGRRVYGTPFYVFGFDELYKYSDITIYIWLGQYTSEIIKQIQTYPVNAEIILI